MNINGWGKWFEQVAKTAGLWLFLIGVGVLGGAFWGYTLYAEEMAQSRSLGVERQLLQAEVLRLQALLEKPTPAPSPTSTPLSR